MSVHTDYGDAIAKMPQGHWKRVKDIDVLIRRWRYKELDKLSGC